jgi:hypothetical protein
VTSKFKSFLSWCKTLSGLVWPTRTCRRTS